MLAGVVCARLDVPGKTLPNVRIKIRPQPDGDELPRDGRFQNARDKLVMRVSSIWNTNWSCNVVGSMRRT